jgi:predicted RNA binding protein YcfA (HicA-like mRNA interferase family)
MSARRLSAFISFVKKSSRHEATRDVSGAELARALGKLGYAQTRQTGSHLRLTSFEGGEHHVTVPLKRALPLGTLRAIFRDIARHRSSTIDEVAANLFS